MFIHFKNSTKQPNTCKALAKRRKFHCGRLMCIKSKKQHISFLLKPLELKPDATEAPTACQESPSEAGMKRCVIQRNDNYWLPNTFRGSLHHQALSGGAADWLWQCGETWDCRLLVATLVSIRGLEAPEHLSVINMCLNVQWQKHFTCICFLILVWSSTVNNICAGLVCNFNDAL